MKGNYWLLKHMSRFCCGLSAGGAERAGRFMGNLFWFAVPPKRKKLAVNNLIRTGITDDRKEALRIARASSCRFGDIALQMLRFPMLNADQIHKNVVIEGQEYLDQLKQEGRGCIFAANHCGNWEMEGAAMALSGYPILAVGTRQSNREFDRFIREYRTMVGQTVEYKTGVRDIYRRLKQGYFIGLLCDQDPGRAGILADLFGISTLTPTGPAHLSLLCDVPIMTIFIRRTGIANYHIVIGKPVWTDRGKNKKAAVLEMTQLINRKLEAWIRKYPEDWFWLHNRWKWTDRLYSAAKTAERGNKEDDQNI